MFKAIMTKSLLAIALAATALPVAASAGEVQNRLNRQQQWLNHGVRDGQITRREYRSIDRQDDRIQAQRNRDLRRNDGHLTRAEYRHLNGELNNTADNLYYDNNNRSRQPGAPLR